MPRPPIRPASGARQATSLTPDSANSVKARPGLPHVWATRRVSFYQRTASIRQGAGVSDMNDSGGVSRHQHLASVRAAARGRSQKDLGEYDRFSHELIVGLVADFGIPRDAWSWVEPTVDAELAEPVAHLQDARTFEADGSSRFRFRLTFDGCDWFVITLQVQRQGERWEVRIMDHGPPIMLECGSPEQAQPFYDRFFRDLEFVLSQDRLFTEGGRQIGFDPPPAPPPRPIP
jgi:hypothetical protein